MTDTPRPPSAEISTSARLEALTESFPDERIKVGVLIDHLDDHAIGLMLLMLALPMVVPNVPGISTVFGVLLAPPAIQLMLGSKTLWLPRFMRNWTVPREGLRRTVKVAAPTLRKVERFFRPRAEALTGFPFTIFFGMQTLILAFVLILPIPGGNAPPALAITIMSLALMARDGLMAIASTIVAIVSLAIAFLVVYFGWVILEWIANAWGAIF